MLIRCLYFISSFLLFCLFRTPFLCAVEQTTFFNQQWLKCVVSIEKYVSKNNLKPVGTGFLVSSENNHMLLVTSKHVVSDIDGKVIPDLAYRINLKEENCTIIDDKTLVKKGGGTWFISKKSDVAIRFMPSGEKTDILKIPLEAFLKKEYVQPGTPILILGFPMGLRSKKYTTPIVRRGIVASKNVDYFIIDAFAFPGNSGGPVLYMPAFQVGVISMSNYISKQSLLGIISAYIPYKDTAISLQTKRPRITFEENSGLTIVVPIDEVRILLKRRDVKELDNKLSGNAQQGS